MMRSYWMILGGVVLLVVGAINVTHSLARSSVPFDDPSDGSAFLEIDEAQNPEKGPRAPAVASPNQAISFPTPDKEPDGIPDDESFPQGLIPDRIRIPSIGLDAPVVSVSPKKVKWQGKIFSQWVVPKLAAVGWHETSAKLGDPGNTVLNGHHNAYGMVFENLYKVKEGEEIIIQSGEYSFTYQVVRRLLLPEKFNSLENRMKNTEWISPSEDKRITLITCWPPESNIYRVIVVAVPVE